MKKGYIVMVLGFLIVMAFFVGSFVFKPFPEFYFLLHPLGVATVMIGVRMNDETRGSLRKRLVYSLRDRLSKLEVLTKHVETINGKKSLKLRFKASRIEALACLLDPSGALSAHYELDSFLHQMQKERNEE